MTIQTDHRAAAEDNRGEQSNQRMWEQYHCRREQLFSHTKITIDQVKNVEEDNFFFSGCHLHNYRGQISTRYGRERLFFLFFWFVFFFASLLYLNGLIISFSGKCTHWLVFLKQQTKYERSNVKNLYRQIKQVVGEWPVCLLYSRTISYF